MELLNKLAILADAAKYDASCASSGSERKDSRNSKGIGSTESMGICHSYAPDGRCISLLKILLTNFCTYDCAYCVNRVSSDVRRARFAVSEVVELTLDFYRRNYIEGLFLSSGIIQSADYTMEQLVAVARTLRETHDFRGYIHLKTIPEASQALLAAAGQYADRLSMNIELPSEKSLQRLAPEKQVATIKRSMATMSLQIREAKSERARIAQRPIVSLPRALPRVSMPHRFAPAGQSTQMIIGADDSTDLQVLATSAQLYGSYQLKRVYYSAFSPIPHASAALPLIAPPLVREHRLYQADWLLRFYGFGVEEITAQKGMLDLSMDPKLAWALAHPEFFPVDLQKASRTQLLRVPGLGVKAVHKLLRVRRTRTIRSDDLNRLHIPIRRVLPFVRTVDFAPRHAAQADQFSSSMHRKTLIAQTPLF